MTGTELTIVLIAVIVGAVAKAVTGMGLPLIAIPIAALFVDLDAAVVTIVFPNMLANGVLAFRERTHLHETPRLAHACGDGRRRGRGRRHRVRVTAGGTARDPADHRDSRLRHHVLRQTGPADRTQRSRRLAPGVGVVAGAFQGAIGISGPIVGSWIHSYRLPRGAHIFSVTSLFFLSGTTQFAVLVASGELAGPGRRVAHRMHPRARVDPGRRVAP